MIAKLKWEIDGCKEQSAELQKEIKLKKEMIEKNKKELKELRNERDYLKKW
jgi:septal ring factor EnvC (AmiA/AmiB activator)